MKVSSPDKQAETDFTALRRREANRRMEALGFFFQRPDLNLT
jgi:hypothetical protein